MESLDTIDVNKIKPRGARVLVSVYKRPTHTASGLILPEAELKVLPVIGKVIAVGPKSEFLKDEIVIFSKYSLDEMSIPTQEGNVLVCLLDDEEIGASL